MEETKNTFGIPSLQRPTPEWAKWVFRIFFYVTSMTAIALSIFTKISPETKLIIMEATTFANVAMHGLSKLVGVKVENDPGGDD